MRYYGCDMRGMLSFQIMYLLLKNSMHGEELAKEIGKRRGDKPKPGTIYPALKDLKNKNLIKSKKTGKLIVYSLTPQGKIAIKRAKEYFIRCFADVFET